MTGRLENYNIYYFQDASHLCTFCARAVVRNGIDQFAVICCWLGLVMWGGGGGLRHFLIRVTQKYASYYSSVDGDRVRVMEIL